jgi:hypothetical protein
MRRCRNAFSTIQDRVCQMNYHRKSHSVVTTGGLLMLLAFGEVATAACNRGCAEFSVGCADQNTLVEYFPNNPQGIVDRSADYISAFSADGTKLAGGTVQFIEYVSTSFSCDCECVYALHEYPCIGSDPGAIEDLHRTVYRPTGCHSLASTESGFSPLVCASSLLGICVCAAGLVRSEPLLEEKRGAGHRSI